MYRLLGWIEGEQPKARLYRCFGRPVRSLVQEQFRQRVPSPAAATVRIPARILPIRQAGRPHRALRPSPALRASPRRRIGRIEEHRRRRQRSRARHCPAGLRRGAASKEIGEGRRALGGGSSEPPPRPGCPRGERPACRAGGDVRGAKPGTPRAPALSRLGGTLGAPHPLAPGSLREAAAEDTSRRPRRAQDSTRRALVGPALDATLNEFLTTAGYRSSGAASHLIPQT
jgi:hypothetical protein